MEENPKPRRFRFSLRTILALAIVVGFISWRYVVEDREFRNSHSAEEFARRKALYSEKCKYHFWESGSFVGYNDSSEAAQQQIREMSTWSEDRRQFHRQMRDKYCKAMESPWQPIEPDPPEPMP